jgi:type I restriction enzyme S subunit
MSAVEGWQTKSLGAVIKDIGDGGTPNTNKKEYFGGTIPWIVIQDICKEISSSKTTLTPIGLDSCSAKLWPADSVILSTGATIGEVGLAKVPVSTKQGIHGIVCGEELLSSFLYYKLQTLRDFLNANAQGSTIREVRATFLRTIPISFPTALPEQTKIAEILSTVDRAIEQTEALIAKQQRIKTGLMQDLLTSGIDEHGNLRSEQTHEFRDSPLGRIPVEWDVRKLDHLTKAIIDCPHTTPKFTQEGILVARTFNIKDGQFLGEWSYVSKAEYSDRILRLEPQQGDVIFTREAPVGEAYVILDNFKVCLGQRTMLLRCDLNACLPEYLVEVIYSEEMRIRFDQKVGGTTNPHLNVGDVRYLAIKQPPINEQQKIITILGEVRRALNWHNQDKSKLHSLKTALMQDLLTGKKRITTILNDTEKIT